jgi:aspartyl-tRNA(Asn)/glutamyl-tRNA(Gln) amidotransferase subunit A
VFNVTGTPTISVPTGFSASGLPLAMQITGRAFDDAMVYRVAHAYCEATGFADRRAPIMMAAARAVA